MMVNNNLDLDAFQHSLKLIQLIGNSLHHLANAEVACERQCLELSANVTDQALSELGKLQDIATEIRQDISEYYSELYANNKVLHKVR